MLHSTPFKLKIEKLSFMVCHSLTSPIIWLHASLFIYWDCQFVLWIGRQKYRSLKTISSLFFCVCGRLRMLQGACDVRAYANHVDLWTKSRKYNCRGNRITADIPMTIVTCLQKQNFFFAHWSCHAVCQVNRWFNEPINHRIQKRSTVHFLILWFFNWFPRDTMFFHIKISFTPPL